MGYLDRNQPFNPIPQPAPQAAPVANALPGKANWGDWQGHYYDTVLHGKGVTGIGDTSQGNQITQTKQQFLDKYKDAIDPTTGKFIPGKVNLYFDNENAGDVYDNLIGYHSGDGKTGGYFAPEVNLDWIKDDRKAGWLAQHGVNPDTLAGAALLAGGLATGGFGLLGGAGAAGAGTASGLAGTLGMAPGALATGLNAGALGTGVGLATGHNIGDSLKGGVMAGLTAGGGSLLAGQLAPTLGTMGANAAVAGGRTLLNGGNLGDALTSAATSGIGQYTNQNLQPYVGDMGASALTNAGLTALRGGNAGRSLINTGINYGMNQAGQTAGKLLRG